MKYPQDFVHRYGAKAGILMYVANELPHIPQAKMIVKTPHETAEEALRRADEAGIGMSRLYRSSAVEELFGYEGDFITEGPVLRLHTDEREAIESVETSTKYLKELGHTHLPDRINVIIAEESPSRYTGRLIKHPNRDDFFIMSYMVASDEEFADYAVLTSTPFGIKPLEVFSADFGIGVQELGDLQRVVEWYNQIVRLPLMDQDWTYQIEFGINPPCLYQVRPFRQQQIAGFKLQNYSIFERFGTPLVFGVTSEEGIDFRVYTEKHLDENFGLELGNNLYVGDLRNAGFLDDIYDGAIFYNSDGILQHHDIK